jgi:hypothetical protein
MRLALFGLLMAVAMFAISGGHVLFLPLFFLLLLGGFLGTGAGTAAVTVDEVASNGTVDDRCIAGSSGFGHPTPVAGITDGAP